MADNDDNDRQKLRAWMAEARENKRGEINGFWQSPAGLITGGIFVCMVVAAIIVRILS